MARGYRTDNPDSSPGGYGATPPVEKSGLGIERAAPATLDLNIQPGFSGARWT